MFIKLLIVIVSHYMLFNLAPSTPPPPPKRTIRGTLNDYRQDETPEIINVLRGFKDNIKKEMENIQKSNK
jgi:hypothetical protein